MSERDRSDRVEPGRSGADTPLMGMGGVATRRAVWILFAIILGAMIVARVLPLGERGSVLVETGIWSVTAAIAAVALAMGWLHSSGVEARVWGLMAIGVCLLLAGQAYYGYRAATAPLSALTSVTPTATFDVLAAVVFLTMLGWLTRFRHASRVAQVRLVIDVVAACIIAAGVLGAVVIKPWFDSLGVTTASTRVLYAVSPVVGAIALVGAVLVVLGVSYERWEPWEKLLAGAVVALGAGLALAPLAFADGQWRIAGGLIHGLADLGWVTGIYLVAMAAIYRHTYSARPWRIRPLAVIEPAYGWLSSVVLPSAEVLAVPAFAYAATLVPEPDARLTRLAVAGFVALAFALRTVLTVAEGDTLMTGATIDPLTGLGTVRKLHDQLATDMAAAVRFREGMSLIVLDVDDFERVNAQGGHAAGDAALVAVGRAVERTVRPQDTVCRVEGDQIAIVLPATMIEDAAEVAARVLDEVRSVPGPGGRSLTASAGVAAFPALAADVTQLVERAEGAAYWSKTHGKDRVTVFDPAVVVSLDAESRIRELKERADLEAVRALAAAVDARDEDTQDHSRNVARHAVALARDLGLSDREVLLVEYAALLHDVGKIGVPDAVLSGGGAMSSREAVALRDHTILGERILSTTQLREILPIVRHHHERWDGSGYPDGLAGDHIPLGARIVALANEYDALRHGLHRGAPLSRTAALQEIDLGLGAAFDPELGERFIGVIGRKYL